MLTTGDTQRLLMGGATLVGSDEETIGRVDDVFLDGTTGRPAWAAVSVGRLRKHTAYVPLADAVRADDGFRVPVTHDEVVKAPRVEAVDGRIGADDELALSRHYGLVPSVDTDGPGPVHDADLPARHARRSGDAGPGTDADDLHAGGAATTVDPMRRHADEDGVPRDAPPTVTPPPPPGDLVDEYPPAPPVATGEGTGAHGHVADASHPPLHQPSDQPGTSPEAGERR